MTHNLTKDEVLQLTDLLGELAYKSDNIQEKQEINKILTMLMTAGYTPHVFRKISSLFSSIGPKVGYSNVSKITLKKYGKCRIIGMTLYRTPLKKMVMSALNLISLGKWDKSRKKYGFDKFFHLALVVTVKCPSGLTKNIIIEKNEVVNISTSYKTNSDTQVQQINIKNKLMSLDSLLDNTRRTVDPKTYFLYDPFKNNCQNFIRYILEANNLYSKEAKDFLFQYISEIIKETPQYVQKFGRKVTDIASMFTRLIGGCNSCPKAKQTRKIFLDHINKDMTEHDDELAKFSTYIKDMMDNVSKN